jgi:hypothetical protein
VQGREITSARAGNQKWRIQLSIAVRFNTAQDDVGWIAAHALKSTVVFHCPTLAGSETGLKFKIQNCRIIVVEIISMF